MSTSAGTVPPTNARSTPLTRGLVTVGWAVAVSGVLVSVLGLAGTSAFAVAVKSFAFDSTSTGLMIVAIGAALAAGAVDDRVGEGQRTAPSVRATSWRNGRSRMVALAALAVMALSLVLFVVSILF